MSNVSHQEKIPSFVMYEFTLEKAMEHAEILQDVQRRDTEATTVITGRHPDFGPIHIIVPAIGNSLILPLVVQSASV